MALDEDVLEGIRKSMKNLRAEADDLYRGLPMDVKVQGCREVGGNLLDKALKLARNEDEGLYEDEWLEIERAVTDEFARIFMEEFGFSLIYGIKE